MKNETFRSTSTKDTNDNIKFIVIDSNTSKALYGLKSKTLTFNSKEEADNFGKQICTNFTTIQINL